MKQIHLRANVGHFEEECFKHFDNERRMFKWISSRIGKKVSSYEECEDWTRENDGLYIEIIEIDDLEDFYKRRQEYVSAIERARTAMYHAQKTKRGNNRDKHLQKFKAAYDYLDYFLSAHPEVWHGEI